jgi:DNA-binding NtrC family response regulator
MHSPETAVILLVANPVAAAGVAAIRQGAFDYLTQPVNPDELAAVVAKALEIAALRRENRILHEQLEVASMAAAFVAESVASRNLAAIVRRAAPANSPVLIEGESGTGKELIARMLHHWSSRANGPFVKVSFKSLSPGDLASGWADSMQRPRAGAAAMLAEYFDRAAGGTIFLDEISEAAAEFQSALLRLIGDENHLRKNAATRTARVVASTNRTFVSELASGRIRPDLYFALNVISIQVAPLRERPEDILPLARHFLASQVAETGRSMVLTPEAEKALLSHSWPGNVRELENTIERAVVMSSSERIAPEALMLGARIPDVLPPPASPEIEVRTRPAREESPKKQSALAHATASETQAATASTVAQEEASRESPLPMEGTLQEVLDHAATSRVSKAIDSARGDRNAAAAALGIDRATLDRLMRRLHL